MKNKKHIIHWGLIILFVFPLIKINRIEAQNYDPVNYIILDDAEDMVPSKGYTGEVSNVFDELRNSRVTLVESGLAVLYKQSYWDPSSGQVEWNINGKGISWAVRSNQDFEFGVKVITGSGTRYLKYYSSTATQTDGNGSYYFNLGTTYQDGNWHDIIRDLDADLDSKETGNTVLSISYVYIKAQTNVAVDDIFVYPENDNEGNDITPPVIHLTGSNNIDILQGEEYVEQGAVCSDNVTSSSVLENNLMIDASDLNVNTPGMYRVRYDVTDEAGNNAKTVYRVVNVRASEMTIGARPVYSTPAELGTFFVSVTGSGKGDGSTISDAVSWEDFLNGAWKNIKAGDVVFFRGGTYYFTTSVPGWNMNEGKKDQPVIFESYPGEWAVFDGSKVDSLDIHSHNGNVTLYGNYIWLRNVEFNRLPHWGPRLWGAYCIIEGVKSHHNLLSGFEVSQRAIANIIRDCYMYENSDIDIKPDGGDNGDLYDEYNLGGNADGATLHSGTFNILTHNTVGENSDDGLDTWQGNLTVFSYNYVSHQGKASYKGHGDGNGLKLGSGVNYGTQVFHNVLYQINFYYAGPVFALKNNASNGAVMSYNTMHQSKYSIEYVPSSRIYRNIILRASHGILNSAEDLAPEDTLENSFNMIQFWPAPNDDDYQLADYCDDAESRMLSIDPESPDFLHPDPNDLFADIGAYADDDALADIVPPTVFPYGLADVNDSTCISNGALYIEHGAFAYDAKDGILPVSVNLKITDTNIDATYLIKYTATDAAGNSSSFIRKVVVGEGSDDPIMDIKKPSFISSSKKLLVYPNPSSGNINVILKDVEGNLLRINIYDINGRLMSVHDVRFNGDTYYDVLNLGNLTNGTYVLIIYDDNNVYKKKIIIRK